MKSRLIACIIVISFISGIVGYWFGFREAWKLGVAAEFMPRGVISSYHLKGIRSGKTENIITGLEFDVDNGLIMGYEVFHHPLRDLLNPVWGLAVYPEFEEYATRLANYRKQNPSQMKTDMFDKVPEDKMELSGQYKEMALGIRESIDKIDAMTIQYTTKR